MSAYTQLLKTLAYDNNGLRINLNSFTSTSATGRRSSVEFIETQKFNYVITTLS